MPCLLDNLHHLEAAEGYATLRLYIQSNRELEQMSRDTRYWPEVLAVKLSIFAGLNLWDMVEIIAVQLIDAANGNPQWLAMAQAARFARQAAYSARCAGSRQAQGDAGVALHT